MTKLDIALRIVQQTGMEQIQVKSIVQMTLDAIVEALAKDGRLELRDFGIFEVRAKKARKARNPSTGTEVMVSEGRRVHFKPGKAMKERIGNEDKISGTDAGVAAT
jgi:integration host factor subunit beta